MPKVLVIYATTDGCTKRVAERIAKVVAETGNVVDLVNAKTMKFAPLPEDYDLVIVSASVHIGNYQRAVKRWVHQHVESLSRKPSAFVSVCLWVLEERPESRLEGEKILRKFFEKTGWHPTMTKVVAGAIPFTRYNFIKKWAMKRIARKVRSGSDTSRDYEYTDWQALDRFTQEVVTLANAFKNEYSITSTPSILLS